MGPSEIIGTWLSVILQMFFFLANISPNGSYFTRPLRVNCNALESIFSILKHTSDRNLSATGYGPRRVDKLINTQRKPTDRDLPLKIFFSGEENATHETVSVCAWQETYRLRKQPTFREVAT